MIVTPNISRIEYLLKLYRISIEEFLVMISEGLKTPLIKSDIFSENVKLSHLKRVDKLFNKGINFYLNPTPIKENKGASVFFRKEKFNSELNIGAKRIVSHFEDLKISLTAISKLSDITFKRQLPIYTLTDKPEKVASVTRKQLYPEEYKNVPKEFLKALIYQLAKFDVFVFEFVEAWNKKETANINGFFLKPNVIVLKRQQKAFRREIFSLIHELGHYLLNDEEIENVDYSASSQSKLNNIERWCNDFAYHFLIGEHNSTMNGLELATASNDYHMDLITEISYHTNLSKLALFTRLLFINKISQEDYQSVKAEMDEEFKLRMDREKAKRELDKQEGRKTGGATPKPINSPLLVNTLQTALYDGVINEYDFCKSLNIQPEKIQNYI